MFRFPTQLRRKPLSFAGKVLRRHSLDHTIVFGAPEQDPGRTRLRGLTGENQTEESTSNGGNLPGRHPKGSIRLSPSSIRPSIGTKNPIPEEMDHREIAVRVPVMNEMQFLFPSEPCKSLKPRSLYVVFFVEIDMRVKRRRARD